MQGLDQKNQDTNFSGKGQGLEKICNILKSDVSFGKTKVTNKKPKLTFKEIVHSELDFADKMLFRVLTALLLIIILYVATSEILAGKINEKITEAETVVNESRKEIAKITNMDTLIKARTNEYQNMIDTIDESNSQISENYSSKNAIPNLLNKIMYNIPTGVQLLSIENTTGKNITITAQAEKYDQLGYFKAALEEEGILTNITTTRGVKQNDLINITITGELPY